MKNILPHSYSRVKQALTCPLAFEQYLQRAQTGVEAEVLQVGTLFHAFAEGYAKHCVAARTSTDMHIARHIARQAYEALAADYALRQEHFIGELVFERTFDNIIQPFTETHVFEVEQVVEIESKTAVDFHLQPCAWDSNIAWFRGRFDLLLFPTPNTAKLVDYKSGFSPEADTLQFKIYAWLVMALYPQIDEVEVEADFVRFNVQKSQTYTRDQWSWLDEQIRAICEFVECLRTYDARPGLHCLTCFYRGTCPAKADIPGAVTDEEQARQAVEAISLLERDLSDTKERLRAWCVEHGTVEHNGTVWGLHAAGGMGFDDATEFITAAQAHGIDPAPYLTVNNTKCKSKKAQAALKPLESLKVNKRSVRFGGKKAGENGGDE